MEILLTIMTLLDLEDRIDCLSRGCIFRDEHVRKDRKDRDVNYKKAEICPGYQYTPRSRAMASLNRKGVRSNLHFRDACAL